MKHTLKVENGRVEYLMKSGKDVVKMSATDETANWMLKNKEVTTEALEGFPGYCIKAGEYYFAAEEAQNAPETQNDSPADVESADDQPKTKRRKKDVVCE